MMDRAVDGYPSSTGVLVNEDNAIAVTAVWCAGRIIAETIASVPLKVFERLPNGRGKRAAEEHSLYRTLHDKPNKRQTSYEYRSQMGFHLAFRGNHYAEIKPGPVSQGGGLIPMNPDATTPVILENGDKAYEFREPGKPVRTLLEGEVSHTQTLSHTGLQGLSIVGLFRETIGLSLAGERHHNETFKNAARPSGALKHPLHLGTEAHDNLRASWEKHYGGLANTGKPMILEEGMEWQQLSMSMEDMQYIESRKFQVAEFARIWRIPPHLLADLEHATFSNIEEQSLEFVMYTMLPWFTNLESRMSVDLLSESDQRRFFVSFVVDGLLRGDIKTRYEAHSIALQNGWLNRNEVRRIEKENSMGPAGDIYTVQLNMVDLEQLSAISAKHAESPTTPTDAAPRALPALTTLLTRELERMIRRETAEMQKGLKKYRADPEGLQRFTADFYERFLPDLEGALLPVLNSLEEITDRGVDTEKLARAMATRHVLDSRYLIERGDRELNWTNRAAPVVADLEDTWSRKNGLSTSTD